MPTFVPQPLTLSLANSGITRLPEHTLKEEKLVPIRIDLEAEGYRLSDTFTWNLNGKDEKEKG